MKRLLSDETNRLEVKDNMRLFVEPEAKMKAYNLILGQMNYLQNPYLRLFGVRRGQIASQFTPEMQHLVLP